MSFPIIIMTKDECEDLETTVRSILDTVSIDIHIFIVDNNSKLNAHRKLLTELEEIENISVKRNSTNRWILGLNETIMDICSRFKTDYFVLTDGDIDFSQCNPSSSCWLTYLIEEMNKNISIGKLGISLNWDYLKSEPELANILEQEKSLYNKNKMIGNLFVSQVDTTAAIYRWDWSIEFSPKFYPDHIRYLRPELYSCRTPRRINVEHLGWKKYSAGNLCKERIDDKVGCFTLIGGSITPEIKSQASFSVRLYHSLFSRVIHKAWKFRRYYMLYRYITLKGRKLFDGQESTEL
ncbi:glycosyltransferase [Vibrio rarus]|uniref:glycosyltransferase n=1 Tax=Vibrio rarus TaxID=413403 RepID=UPI0021C4217D|nr:glycosyltransferase [Vibrio rarus]